MDPAGQGRREPKALPQPFSAFTWLADENSQEEQETATQERTRYRAWRLGSGMEVPFARGITLSQQQDRHTDAERPQPLAQRQQNSTDSAGQRDGLEQSAVEAGATCPICLDILQAPTALQGCGHTFCTTCLDKLHDAAEAQPFGHACPVCRRETSLLPAANTPRVLLGAYLRKSFQPTKKEDERHSLFEDLVGEDQRNETLDYRRRYQTWRRKGMAGAKGEFADRVTFHFDAYNPPQPAAPSPVSAVSSPTASTSFATTVTFSKPATAPASTSVGDCKMASQGQAQACHKEAIALPLSTLAPPQEAGPAPEQKLASSATATAILGSPSCCCI